MCQKKHGISHIERIRDELWNITDKVKSYRPNDSIGTSVTGLFHVIPNFFKVVKCQKCQKNRTRSEAAQRPPDARAAQRRITQMFVTDGTILAARAHSPRNTDQVLYQLSHIYGIYFLCCVIIIIIIIIIITNIKVLFDLLLLFKRLFFGLSCEDWQYWYPSTPPPPPPPCSRSYTYEAHLNSYCYIPYTCLLYKHEVFQSLTVCICLVRRDRITE